MILLQPAQPVKMDLKSLMVIVSLYALSQTAGHAEAKLSARYVMEEQFLLTVEHHAFSIVELLVAQAALVAQHVQVAIPVIPSTP